MRIAFVSDAVDPWSIGGIDTLVRVEAEALAKDHDVHFYTFRWPNMEGDFVKNNVHYHTMHHMTMQKFYRHGRRSIRGSVLFAIQILRIFKRRFDVIQANQFPILHLLTLKVYCKITGCKLIIDTHEIWDSKYWTDYLGAFKGKLADRYSRYAMNLGDLYFSNSSITSFGLSKIGVDKSKIIEFAPIIDDALIRSIPEEYGSKEVIFSGRLIREKRLDKWLYAIKDASEKIKLHALIIGEGPEEKELKALSKRLGIDKIVEFRHFYKNKEDLYKRIKKAHVLLHMSEREGLSIIAMESLSLGTPVLLPTYSPIPKEVRCMCIVEDETNIPNALIKILNKEKSSSIKFDDRIKGFYVSNIPITYKKAFRILKIS